MIDRNKVISQSRQQEAEYSFETMVGCRKKRYCNTPEQKKRTEFFEDYYLLYTRKDKEIKILKKALELAKNEICTNEPDCECCVHYLECDSWGWFTRQLFLKTSKGDVER